MKNILQYVVEFSVLALFWVVLLGYFVAFAPSY